jgi:type I restriction enzyme M protein
MPRGSSKQSTVEGPRANGKSNGGPSSAVRSAEPVEVRPGEKLTVDRLERYLWSAADILRGSIDSSDYKNFIFGLLFLKRCRATRRTA